MGEKRKRDSAPPQPRKGARGAPKNGSAMPSSSGSIPRPKKSGVLLPKKPTCRKRKRKPNSFLKLPNSEDELVRDYSAGFRESSPDIVLVDSDSDSDIVVESEKEGEAKENGSRNNGSKDNGPKNNSSKKENGLGSLADNADFIGFGFESSAEEEEDYTNYSDDGVLSADEHGVMAEKGASPFPWVKDHDHSKQKEIADWLTMEIKDFVNYISPGSSEIIQRNTIVARLKAEIHRYWPHAEAHVFGSCATDLYLPGSDIDMVVISKAGDLDHRSRLYQLSSFLRSNKLARNIEVIAKAKVPIIKFCDPESGIPIDISFEKSNGLDAARKIRKWLASTPGLRELVLVVKQFLRSRRLNNVHVGGLGGYSTIVLCYHFLQLHPKISTGSMSATDNLGTLLIEFFELYGRNFAYDNLIVSLDPETDMPRYLLKRNHRWLDTSNSSFALVIQDPSDATNNISRSSYNLRDIKKAFGGAYQLLVEKCYSLNSASYKQRLGSSILGDIIKFKGSERDFNDDRDKVVNEALIVDATANEETGNESDGFEGNDKYYFSDMTCESESESENEPPRKKRATETSTTSEMSTTSKSSNGNISQGSSVRANSSNTSNGSEQVLEHLGIKEDGDSDEDEASKNLLDKDAKRDYWRQKGLEL